MAPGRRLLLAAAALVVVFSSPDARAFCRITTIETVPDGEDLTACYDTTHPPVWWRSACVGLSVEARASKYASYAVVTGLLFDQVAPNWQGAVCPGGGHPSVSLVDLGPTTCDDAQANLYGPNTNAVIFHDDTWPHEGDVGCTPGECCDGTIALTTVTFHPDTGELWDADIEVNSACNALSTTLPVPSDRIDLQSVLQHETGHVLGLAHPPDPEAIMFYRYTPGSDGKRTLNSDDVDGVCSIYTPEGPRAVARDVSAGGTVAAGACDATPRNGFASACVSAADDLPPATTSTALTCDTSPRAAGSGVAGGLVAAFLAALARRRRVRAVPTCYLPVR